MSRTFNTCKSQSTTQQIHNFSQNNYMDGRSGWVFQWNEKWWWRAAKKKCCARLEQFNWPSFTCHGDGNICFSNECKLAKQKPHNHCQWQQHEPQNQFLITNSRRERYTPKIQTHSVIICGTFQSEPVSLFRALLEKRKAADSFRAAFCLILERREIEINCALLAVFHFAHPCN